METVGQIFLPAEVAGKKLTTQAQVEAAAIRFTQQKIKQIA